MKALGPNPTDPTGLWASSPTRQIDGTDLELATASNPGAVSAADKSAIDAIASDIATAVAAEASARAAADNALDARLEPVEIKLATIATGAEVNASANVGTAHASISVPVFDGETGATQNFRRLVQGRGTRVRANGQTNVIEHEPSFVSRAAPRPRAFTVSGSKIAGATLRPNITGDVDPAIQGGNIVHDGQHLHPFTTWVEHDSNGYPHSKFRQMTNQNAADPKDTHGYEDGQLFQRGDMVRRPGRGARYETRGLLRNLGWTDAFAEFVLEPNPSVTPAGVFNGANRMRFPTGELGFLTTTDVLLTFWCELAVQSAAKYSWEGGIKIYSSTHAKLLDVELGGYTDAGHNWLRNLTILQLRWRVDRIANIDTYNDDFQGSNQGADELRLDMRRMKFQPIGFEPLREGFGG